MRRFEFVDGTSSKFWEIEVADAVVTVRYGRLGTAGTTQTKSWPDTAKAQAEAAKLVREKVGKGYVEQGVAAGCALPALPAAAPVTPVAKPARTVAAPLPAETPAVAAYEPSGEFRWNAAWRKLRVDWSARPVPPASDVDALLAASPLAGIRRGTFYTGQRTAPPLPPLDAAEQHALLTPTALRQATLDDWTRLMVSVAEWGRYSNTPYPHGGVAIYWAVHLCAACAGVETTLAAYVRLFCGPVGSEFIPGYRLAHGNGYGDGVMDLRMLLTTLDADAAARARERLAQFASTGPLQAIVAASLLPRDSALIDVALAAFAQHRELYGWSLLLDCDLSAAQIEGVFAHPTHWINLDRDIATKLALHAATLSPERSYAAFDALLSVVAGASTDTRVALAKVVRALDNAVAMRLLVQYQERKEMRAQLDEFAQAWPALAIATAAGLGAALDKTARQWFASFTAGYPEAAAQARERVDDDGCALIDGVVKRGGPRGDDAPLAAVPAVLRDPPWLRPPVARKPVAALAAFDVPPELVWPAGLEARWRARCPADPLTVVPRYAPNKHGSDYGAWVVKQFGLGPEWVAKFAAGERPPHDDASRGSEAPAALLLLPDAAGAALWAWANPARWYDYGDVLRGVAARYGVAFVPGLVRYAQFDAVVGLRLALPFRAPALAPVAATALYRSRKARGDAQAWLLAHADCAAAALLPLAGGNDAAATDAQFALRWLARNGRADELQTGAARHGDAGHAALDAVLSFDPLSLFPARLPKLPAFWSPRSYARPELASGGALPDACLDALGMMLAFSTPEQPYAGVDHVRDACTPASLSAFAWDLFEAWQAAGSPSKEQWAFTALGLIGGNDAARRLTPLIRAWPGEGGHARAVLGLDVLAAIGSDAALMYLNAIGQKVKFKALQQHARNRIDAIAESRGMSAEELADRLVPDLGLDDDGSLLLDFGPRRFRVGFDEELKPYVADENGARLKDLPKPNRSDDDASANAASERYKNLKKDARALATLQIQRLERAMIDRRRWSASEFRLFLLGHPLLRHLVRRLLWGVYRDGAVAASFRVAEDASLADADDATYTLADDATVGIVHALELDDATTAAFGQVFADYEILQPFRQLGRDAYVLTDDEKGANEVTRYAGRKVATGSVFGLENRGWRRGDPQDGGWIGWFVRELPDEIDAELELDPGTVVGDITFEPVQRLKSLALRRRGTWGHEGQVTFATLDAIVASELLRDIDALAQV